jgi:hypothetical protein
VNYQVTWTDRNTGVDHSTDHGDSLDDAKRDANTKSNLHCSVRNGVRKWRERRLAFLRLWPSRGG